jgi:hypothetical protein
MGAVTFLARTRPAWARMMARRGGADDASRADELAREAAAVARRLGAATIEARAAVLLSELGDR